MALLVLAGGLALGLGGRDVAAEMLRAEMLRGAYDTGQRNKGQVKRDMQQGRMRAEQKAGQAKAQADSGSSWSLGATTTHVAP